jgi:hypothetical protein
MTFVLVAAFWVLAAAFWGVIAMADTDGNRTLFLVACGCCVVSASVPLLALVLG